MTNVEKSDNILKSLQDDNEALKKELAEKTEKLKAVEEKVMVYESKYNELQSQCEKSQAQCKELAEKLQSCKAGQDLFNEMLDDIQKHLKLDLQPSGLKSGAQGSKEGDSPKEQDSASEIDARLTEQYVVQLRQAQQELRINKEKIMSLYENQIKSLKAQAQQKSGTVVLKELEEAKSEIESLKKKISDFESENIFLSASVRDLDELRERERVRYISTMTLLEAEVKRTQEEMTQQVQIYKNLMDIKLKTLNFAITEYCESFESEKK